MLVTPVVFRPSAISPVAVLRFPACVAKKRVIAVGRVFTAVRVTEKRPGACCGVLSASSVVKERCRAESRVKAGCGIALK